MLTGKNAIITGASQGLGKEIAKAYLKQGANICICARNVDDLDKSLSDLRKEKREDSQKIIIQRTDIGKIKEIDTLFEVALNIFGYLDIIVNNAGIHGPIGPTDKVDWEGIEQVVRVNLMGTLYSMQKAVQIYKKQGKGGRIINLSGGGATKSMPNFMGYAISKTAIIRATETMADEVMNEKIYINAIAPGALNTRLLDQALKAGAEATGEKEYKKLLEQQANGGASLENAAQLAVYLASDVSEGISGKLISAVWDDWKSLDIYKKEIQESDIYTLRRIIPEDRGIHLNEVKGM